MRTSIFSYVHWPFGFPLVGMVSSVVFSWILRVVCCRHFFPSYHLTLALFTFVVVQLLSHICFFATPWTVACQASLSFTVSQSLLKFMSVESLMPSNHLILFHPLFLLPSVFPRISVFSIESKDCLKKCTRKKNVPDSFKTTQVILVFYRQLLNTISQKKTTKITHFHTTHR